MGFVLSTCAVALGALAVAGWVTAVADSAPSIKDMPARTAGRLSQVFASDGSSLGYIHSPNLRVPVNSNRIPLVLKHATVAIEDRRFYQHGALDYQGILRAAIKDLFGGRTLQGASTLTMQLIDNLYLQHRSRNLHYKIVQAKLAQELYKQHNRNWILTEYLNDVPYGTVGGQTAYGVGAASQVFFNKPVGQLGLADAALLAGLPQAPSEYNPFNDPGAARQRRWNVLQAMVKSGYISQAQAEHANAESLGVQHNENFDVHQQPYVFDYIVAAVAPALLPGQAVHRLLRKGRQRRAQDLLDDRSPRRAARPAVRRLARGRAGPARRCALLDRPDRRSHPRIRQHLPVQPDQLRLRDRRPASARLVAKVFALMTLIHDYDGDPSRPTTTRTFWLRDGCPATRPTRFTPPSSRMRARSTSPARRSSRTTPFSRSSRSTWAWTSSTRRRTRWGSRRTSTATPPR